MRASLQAEPGRGRAGEAADRRTPVRAPLALAGRAAARTRAERFPEAALLGRVCRLASRPRRGCGRGDEGTLRVRVRGFPPSAPNGANRLPLPCRRVAAQGDRARGARAPAVPRPEKAPHNATTPTASAPDEQAALGVGGSPSPITSVGGFRAPWSAPHSSGGASLGRSRLGSSKRHGASRTHPDLRAAKNAARLACVVPASTCIGSPNAGSASGYADSGLIQESKRARFYSAGPVLGLLSFGHPDRTLHRPGRSCSAAFRPKARRDGTRGGEE